MGFTAGTIWISELGLRDQQSLCLKHEIEYINFPIADRSIPAKGGKIELLIDQLYQKIQTGNSVVIHCRMGIGRCSIIAGCILLKVGFKTEQVLQIITAARGLKVPDTDQQVQWLKDREKSI